MDDSNTALVVDSNGAAVILGVTLLQFDVMVNEGLFSPLPGSGERRFDAHEVRALRVMGN